MVFVALWSGTGLLSPHHRLAQNPNNIERITGVDLPAIALVESSDNLERGSSRWDWFDHRTVFAEELSDETIHQLERKCQTDPLHWRKSDASGYYVYLDDDWNRDDGIYCISCCIYKDGAYVEYYVDEFENVIFAGLIVMWLLVVAFILVIWGLGMLVKAIVYRFKR